MQRMPNAQKATLTTAGSTQTPKLAMTRTLDKKDQLEALQKKHQMTTAKSLPLGRVGRVATSTPKGRGGARGARAKPIVPEVVTLSSDDESETSENKSNASNSIKKDEPVVPRKHYEPEIVEDVVTGEFEFFVSPATNFVRVTSVTLGHFRL